MLHPDEITRLASWFISENRRRRGSPTPAETRRRLAAAHKAAVAYADALSEFGQEECGLAGWSVDELDDRLAAVEAERARITVVLPDLDAHGARRGGRGRRVLDLYHPTPRWRLGSVRARANTVGWPGPVGL
jgi:uncharacterized small protein (DUF1192 family)